MNSPTSIPNFFGDANTVIDWSLRFQSWCEALQQHPDLEDLYLDYLFDWTRNNDTRPLYILLCTSEPVHFYYQDRSRPSFLDIVERCFSLMNDNLLDSKRLYFFVGSNTFQKWSPSSLRRDLFITDELPRIRLLQAVFDAVFYAVAIEYADPSEKRLLQEERDRTLAALGYPNVWTSYEQALSSLGEPLRISSLYNMFKSLHTTKELICLPGLN